MVVAVRAKGSEKKHIFSSGRRKRRKGPNPDPESS